MNSNRNWIIACGLCLAAAALLRARAEDLPLPKPLATELEAASPANPAGLVPIAEATPLIHYEVDFPSGQQDPVGRWHEHCRAKYWGYPEEFQDAPLGAMMNRHVATSICNGRAARVTVCQYDFLPGSDKLKPRGKAQVAKFAAWLSVHPMLVFIEPSRGAPRLDEARRRAVVRELAGGPCPIPAELVVVGYAASRGLGGIEALVIDGNRLSLTSSRGVGAGAAAGSSGGASGSSASPGASTGS